VRYRAIRVRLLPDNLPSLGTPIADRELDELVTQFSNDNLPLIDLGLSAPAGPAAEALARETRRYGITPGALLPIEALARYPRSVFVVNDRDRPVDPAVLRSAKAAGAKIAFSSGGDSHVDEARFKARLLAIKAAGLASTDFWIPGRNN
jgi:hypothetical protein